MFDLGSNNVAAFGLQDARGAQNGQIGALSAAGGKDDFAGFGAQDLCRPVARVVEVGPGLPPDVVHARRITPDFAQER